MVSRVWYDKEFFGWLLVFCVCERERKVGLSVNPELDLSGFGWWETSYLAIHFYMWESFILWAFCIGKFRQNGDELASIQQTVVSLNAWILNVFICLNNFTRNYLYRSKERIYECFSFLSIQQFGLPESLSWSFSAGLGGNSLLVFFGVCAWGSCFLDWS